MKKNDICVTVRGVIIDEDHILLCRTLDLPSNFYFLPGGHIEHGEKAEDALQRELMEETGVYCKIKRFLGSIEYITPTKHASLCHNHEYGFIFEASGEELKFRSPIEAKEKNIELLWMPVSDLSKIDIRPEVLNTLIVEWLNQDLNNAFRR